MMETLYNFGYKITGFGLEWASKSCREPKIIFEELAANAQENHALILATCLAQALKEVKIADDKILSLERELEYLKFQNQRLFDLVSLRTLLAAKAGCSPPPFRRAGSGGVEVLNRPLGKTMQSALPLGQDQSASYSAQDGFSSTSSLQVEEKRSKISPADAVAANTVSYKPCFMKKPRCKAPSSQEPRGIGFSKPKDVRSVSLRMHNAIACTDATSPAGPRQASEPASRNLKGTEHEKPHRNPACQSSPPASSKSRDSCKPQLRAGKIRDASRCNPKWKSRGKAANFKQQNAANPAASAESTHSKQHKESHEEAPHGQKVRFRDVSPAASESGSQRSQRDRRGHRTSRIPTRDSRSSKYDEFLNHTVWSCAPRKLCLQQLLDYGWPEDLIKERPLWFLKRLLLNTLVEKVNRWHQGFNDEE